MQQLLSQVTQHRTTVRLLAMSLSIASVTIPLAPAAAQQTRTTGPGTTYVAASPGGGGARALTIRRQFWTNEPGTVYGYGPGNYVVGPYGILYGPYPLDYFRRP